MSPATSIEVNYNNKTDVLYVMRKEADKNTRNVEAMPGVFFRLDIKKGEIVGLIIHNASEHYPDIASEAEANVWKYMEIFDFTLDLINSGNKASR